MILYALLDQAWPSNLESLLLLGLGFEVLAKPEEDTFDEFGERKAGNGCRCNSTKLPRGDKLNPPLLRVTAVIIDIGVLQNSFD